MKYLLILVALLGGGYQVYQNTATPPAPVEKGLDHYSFSALFDYEVQFPKKPKVKYVTRFVPGSGDVRFEVRAVNYKGTGYMIFAGQVSNVFPDADEETLESMVEAFRSEVSDVGEVYMVSQRDVQVSGFPAVEFVFKNEEVTLTSIVVKNGKTGYSINTYAKKGKTDLTKEFLESFKLLG
ncbi:hypothetical protein [Litoribacillus peritrichatus]|uniref:Uncharacterized protein n=1 Tax=Litoribacillus peritrichatus TaxID=718191 RepID=A0ABP7MEL7_9GAMM